MIVPAWSLFAIGFAGLVLGYALGVLYMVWYFDGGQMVTPKARKAWKDLNRPMAPPNHDTQNKREALEMDSELRKMLEQHR